MVEDRLSVKDDHNVPRDSTFEPALAMPVALEMMPEPESEPDPPPDDWGYWTVSKSKKPKKPSCSSSKHPLFRNLDYPLPPLRSYCNSSLLISNTPNHDYLPVFLSHARLCVFATEYKIPSLKALALNKLHSALSHFEPYETQHGDIIKLTTYVYRSSFIRKKDPLRELVIQYIVQEANRAIASSEQCLALVETCGDLLAMVFERMS
ncbi:hypothetical protein MMC14_008832 [Varicellaria rhodocarpa]|nr:hypothetical protein [Varicellaria rhodocarpa]